MDQDGRTAIIAIDRWLALVVVAATVGLPPPIALRRLGPVERGVLGGHLAALLARWSTSIAVDLGEHGGDGGGEPLIGVRLRAEVSGAAGAVRIHVPAEWLSLGHGPARPRWRDSRVATLRLFTVAAAELALTTLRFAELEAAGVGDAVVFEGYRWGGEGLSALSSCASATTRRRRVAPNAAGNVVLAGRISRLPSAACATARSRAPAHVRSQERRAR